MHLWKRNIQSRNKEENDHNDRDHFLFLGVLFVSLFITTAFPFAAAAIDARANEHSKETNQEKKRREPHGIDKSGLCMKQ